MCDTTRSQRRPMSRADRRLGARSPRAVSITHCDGSSQARPGCRGTTRGTSAGRISVRCVLSVRPRVASVQVERPARPSGPLLIRGFRVRAPGAPPAKTSLVDLVFVGRVPRSTNTACLALRAGHSITQSDCQPEPPEPALPNRRWWEWVPWAVPQECRLFGSGRS
jgi:hypothetical protein